MRGSLKVVVAGAVAAGLACASGTGGAAGARAGAASARFAAASRVYAQARQRETALDPRCTLATAVRSMARPEECAGCHDGMMQPIHAEHASWVNYLTASATRHLRAIGTVPVEIVLANDDGGHPVMVSCTSCHAGSSSYPSHVALPMDRSALCVGCHEVSTPGSASP
jgi:predicted CXXCH cytochrome family protein